VLLSAKDHFDELAESNDHAQRRAQVFMRITWGTGLVLVVQINGNKTRGLKVAPTFDFNRLVGLAHALPPQQRLKREGTLL
jgi:hypothetical protein